MSEVKKAQRPTLDDLRSPVNRSDPAFKLPVQAYLEAVDRDKARMEERRLDRMHRGFVPKPWTDAEARQQRRDSEIQHIYRHHYTDQRGALTQKKGNLVVAKE